MKIFGLSLVALLLLSGCAATGGAQQSEDKPYAGRQLVFGGFGGSFEQVMRDEMLVEFEKETGIKVEYVSGTAGGNYAKIAASGASSGIDVVWGNDITHLRGKRDGLWASLDTSVVDNLKDVHELALDPDGIGVGQGINAFVLEYNTEQFAANGIEAPDSWLDLWSPELAGHVLLFDIGVSQSQFFIPVLAEIIGSGQSDVDAAFAKLSELNDVVASYPANAAEADQLFLQDAGWIVLNNLARVQELKKTGFPVEGVYPKEGGILFVNYIDIVKGSPDEDIAQVFVNFMISKYAQELNASQMSQGPVNVKAELTSDVKALVPASDEVLDALIRPDVELVLDNVEDWTARWQREVVK